MDVETILQACWRHRLRLLACAVVGAVVLSLGGLLLVPKKYTSSTDLSVMAVFPAAGIDASASQVYVQQPDRYVATQVQILSSRAAASKVASELGLSTSAVANAVGVTQLDKSDVIRVTATSRTPDTSAKIAERLVDDYLQTSTLQSAGQYKVALDSIAAQQQALEKQIADLPPSLTSGSGANGPGQSTLSALIAQDSQLSVQREQMIVGSRTAAGATHVVSRASANPVPTGPGAKALAVYGLALGLAVGLCWVAMTTGPGRSLSDLGEAGAVDGVPVLGMLRRGRSRRRRPGEIADVRTLPVAGELAHLVELKGPLRLLVMGGRHSAGRIGETLAPAVQRLMGRHPAITVAAAAPGTGPGAVPAAASPITVEPLMDFLRRGGSDDLAVLAVDVDTVSPGELTDALAGLRTYGVDVLGIVGTR